VETIATEAVTLQFLLEQYNIPIPVKLPYATEPRLDEIVPPELPNDATPTPEG
jgi:pilus assembly protein CpaB